ncbi:threonine ammonia-lyase, biosynthetic [uncultured Desulfovibrio sp.]|uniref:threonine ammonia-lyase, biosynthetic n=1 Tax=uncultured Desulfovibrio sp. TaxID=167968 RepID=UPI00262440C4|nr:threonine ammonia-lyase, biosynthetic [uncultured Desulfovibrio sp.]
MHDHSDYLNRILLSRVYDVAVETPLDEAVSLSRRMGNKVLLKREDLQPVFSFKLRGAYNKMARLSPEELRRGVIAASAGNHAQGVALSAQRLGCEATIVMPVTTPAIKISAVRRLGGQVVLSGESFSDAWRHTRDLIRQSGAVFIPPFEDPDVIAGQGTIGMEILRQHPDDIHAVFVPIGGGGMAAGVAAYIKHLRPDIRLIGVEPVDSDAMRRSIMAGYPVELSDVGLFADGVAVKLVGEETFALCRDLLDDIITVDTDAICGAIKDIFEDTRVVAEPAGALSLAGLRAYAAGGIRNATLVAIVSGANMNFDRLSHVVDRSEIGAEREALLAVTIPEKVGSFRHLCATIGKRSITELCTRFADPEKARVLVGIKIKGRGDAAEVLADLREQGFSARDLSDNELAKLHLRHMVGGNAPQIANERLLRFAFPERPGALLDFMDAMRVEFNITLFQYRYHGADYGRVLVGFDAPEDQREAFEDFLARVERMGYPHVDESDNPAYKMFLGWHDA